MLTYKADWRRWVTGRGWRFLCGWRGGRWRWGDCGADDGEPPCGVAAFAGVETAVVSANSAEEVKTVLDGDPFMPTGLVAAEIHPAYLEDLSGVKFIYPAKAAN